MLDNMEFRVSSGRMSDSNRVDDLPPIVDRRNCTRKRVLQGGLIVSRDGTQTWDCSIKDVTELGAKIRIPEGQVIPERCILVNLKEGMAYQVIVQWIHLPLAGLRCLETYRLQDLSDSKLMFVRRLWQERRGR